MSSSPLRVLVCGNVNLELGFAAPSLTLPAAESAEQPGPLTLGVSGVGFNVTHALARLGQRCGGWPSWGTTRRDTPLGRRRGGRASSSAPRPPRRSRWC
ncbi:hypothetical protein [Deinococcus aerius]|uniref:hypothetical protein n=1 Tax=Deinococcus aerius TaxID=200253 RepID=UPI00105746EA|nr:hypothetical protein [Deinococcus aerius]